MVLFFSCDWSDLNGLSFSEGKIQRRSMTVSMREGCCIFVGGWEEDLEIFFQMNPNIYRQLDGQNTISLREGT